MPDEPENKRHDVVVVGARCAGAATAMLLARLGHDVVVVDRASFPSDTLSTHAIARSGVVQLHRWGLLDRVLESGAPPIRRVSFHVGDDVTTKVVKASAGIDLLVAPRRHILDTILVEAAIEAGADLRTGISVSDVTRDADGRVDGVVGRDAGGAELSIRARFVVGADGIHSRIARAVDAPVVDERHRNGAVHYAYFAGLDWTGIEFHLSDGFFAGVFPTHAGQANVWVCAPAATGSFGAAEGRDAAFDELVQKAAPALAARLATAERTSPVRGFKAMPNRLTQPVGLGWALVGDAGYVRDAITGHGISDAFRDAELLARSLDAALTDRSIEARELDRYAAERDQHVAELFDLTCRLATFPPIDEFVRLQKRLSIVIDEEARMLAALPCPPPAPARPVGRAARRAA